MKNCDNCDYGSYELDCNLGKESLYCCKDEYEYEVQPFDLCNEQKFIDGYEDYESKILRRWISEYIEDVDLSKIEWLKLNNNELEKFYEENYLDIDEYKYVSDNKFGFFTPIGLNYLSFDLLDNKYNYLLGIVDNNIGKKTIVSAMIYLDKYYVFEEQDVPLTYISSVETNYYFRDKGLYNKLCNEVINFINPYQHILISSESDMGRRYGVINKLRNILISCGFDGLMFVDDGLIYSNFDFYNAVNSKKRKLK